MSSPEEAEKLFAQYVPTDPLPVNPDDGPLPHKVREALVWCIANGVAECELPGLGKFVFRAGRAPAPASLEEVKAAMGLDQTRQPQVTGYDPTILFASSPNPFVGKPPAPDQE